MLLSCYASCTMLHPYKTNGLFSLAVRLLLCLLMLPASAAHAEQHEKQLVVGILPYLTPITLLKRFEPLRKHLSKSLGYNITLKTAPNYNRFKDETENDKYDIVFTAPHFVPDAIDSGYYQIVATTSNPLSAVLVTRNDSPVQNISEFTNPVIATPPESAIITIIGKRHFDKAGLRPSHFDTYNSHNNAFHTVLRHKADAAIISNNVYNAAIRAKKPLRIIAQSEGYPGVTFLSATRLPAELRDSIRQSLLSLQKTPEGNEFLRRTTYPGFIPATDGQFEPLRDILGK